MRKVIVDSYGESVVECEGKLCDKDHTLTEDDEQVLVHLNGGEIEEASLEGRRINVRSSRQLQLGRKGIGSRAPDRTRALRGIRARVPFDVRALRSRGRSDSRRVCGGSHRRVRQRTSRRWTIAAAVSVSNHGSDSFRDARHSATDGETTLPHRDLHNGTMRTLPACKGNLRGARTHRKRTVKTSTRYIIEGVGIGIILAVLLALWFITP